MHLSQRLTRLARSTVASTISHSTQRTILPTTSTTLLHHTQQHRNVTSQVHGSGSEIHNKVTWILHQLFKSESGRIPEAITLKSGKHVNKVSDANDLNDSEQHELLQQINERNPPTDKELRDLIQYDTLKYNIPLPITLPTTNKKVSSVSQLQKLKPAEKVELRQVMWEQILEREQNSNDNDEVDPETQAAVEQGETETRPITMMIIVLAGLGLLTIMNVRKGAAAPKDELADRIQLRAVRKTKKPEPLPPPPEGVPDFDERATIGVKTISPLRIA